MFAFYFEYAFTNYIYPNVARWIAPITCLAYPLAISIIKTVMMKLVKEYELERLVSIMKRYITIGDGVHSFENLIVENKMMKTFRTNEYENM